MQVQTLRYVDADQITDNGEILGMFSDWAHEDTAGKVWLDVLADRLDMMVEGAMDSELVTALILARANVAIARYHGATAMDYGMVT